MKLGQHDVVETSFDPPNPWLGYRACLENPPDCTHLLIVQDDCIAPRNLTPALGLIAARHPQDVVCLYVGMLPPQKGILLQAAKRGEVYADLSWASAFMPVVATMWPIEKARHFYAWSATVGQRRRRNGQILQEASDDAIAGWWWKRHRERVVATIPSLIEHPDDVISTIGKSNSGRTACFWHGEDWDALSVSW